MILRRDSKEGERHMDKDKKSSKTKSCEDKRKSGRWQRKTMRGRGYSRGGAERDFETAETRPRMKRSGIETAIKNRNRQERLWASYPYGMNDSSDI